MIPAWVRRFCARQEVALAMGLSWCVLPVVCTLMGFYLGTFVDSQHIQDLQGGDIDKGVIGGVIGFVVSIVVALGMTAIFPKTVERDYAAREAAYAEHDAAHNSGHGAHH